jgi:quercetin dioxygenase-like cupin family protein
MSTPTSARACPLPGYGCSRYGAVVLLSVLSLRASAAGPSASEPMNGVVKPLAAVHFERDGDVKCLLAALESGDAAKGPSTFILKAPPGCVVPWHYHSAQEQAVIIRGALKMEMDGRSPVTLGAGGFAAMASKAAHQFSCLGPTPCLLTVAFDRAYDIFWVTK